MVQKNWRTTENMTTRQDREAELRSEQPNRSPAACRVEQDDCRPFGSKNKAGRLLFSTWAKDSLSKGLLASWLKKRSVPGRLSTSRSEQTTRCVRWCICVSISRAQMSLTHVCGSLQRRLHSSEGVDGFSVMWRMARGIYYTFYSMQLAMGAC